MADWDVIVIGLGGVGSAAVYHLASAGARVLGLDQFDRAHTRGSSHGKTRVIRQAYFEDPAYVPLLRRAYELWDDLQARSRRCLFHRNGLVEIGPPGGTVISGVKRSAAEHDLAIESYTMSETSSRWPGLCGREDWEAILESNAGLLEVEPCVLAHLELAEQAGAVCRHQTPVVDWQIDGSGVRVSTSDGNETAGRLVIAAGGWTSQLISELGIELTVLRKHQYWLRADETAYSLDSGFPCFFFETDEGYFYGFPSLSGSGVKVARHDGGQKIDRPSASQTIDRIDQHAVLEFRSRHLPGVTDQLVAHSPCHYTMTADEHFIVDRHPKYDQVIVVAGLSGHGFKFTSVLGEISSQLASDRETALETSLFSINRLMPP